MPKYYRVKATENTQVHSENNQSLIDGYLAWCGEVQLYTRGEAIKKANMFNGKIEEFNHPLIDTMRDSSLTQISRSAMSEGLLKALDGREAFTDTNVELGETIYEASVFEEVLGENVVTDVDVLQELTLLSQLVMTEYVQVVNV